MVLGYRLLLDYNHSWLLLGNHIGLGHHLLLLYLLLLNLLMGGLSTFKFGQISLLVLDKKFGNLDVSLKGADIVSHQGVRSGKLLLKNGWDWRVVLLWDTSLLRNLVV